MVDGQPEPRAGGWQRLQSPSSAGAVVRTGCFLHRSWQPASGRALAKRGWIMAQSSFSNRSNQAEAGPASQAWSRLVKVRNTSLRGSCNAWAGFLTALVTDLTPFNAF
jgi:hypothetical protein